MLEDGHEVVVHARNADRLTAVRHVLDRGAAAVVGDLSDLEETRGVAAQVNVLGRMAQRRRHQRAARSARQRGRPVPPQQAFVPTLAIAVARLWTDVVSNAVDPGWVPTKMRGAGAPDDLRLGHLTQEWPATSDDPEARTSGGYWHHQRRAEPDPAVHDQQFQDSLLDALARFTATRLG